MWVKQFHYKYPKANDYITIDRNKLKLLNLRLELLQKAHQANGLKTPCRSKLTLGVGMRVPSATK